MIVVMKLGSTPKQVEHVVKLVKEMGLKDHVIVGTERTVVAVIGDDRFKDRAGLGSGGGGVEGGGGGGMARRGVQAEDESVCVSGVGGEGVGDFGGGAGEDGVGGCY